MKRVVLILPTYNEKDNIETLIISIQKVFQKLGQYQLQILVVDDFSPDGTAKVVERLTAKFQNIALISKKKEGLGAAIIYGVNYAFKYFSPELFIQIDADWQHNPELLPAFFNCLEKGADFVIGSRYIKGGSIPINWGINRKIYSIAGNAIVRIGLGMMTPFDWTSGYRLYKSDVFRKVGYGLEKYSGYTFQVAFLRNAKTAGYKIAEVPLQFVDRIHGRSKIAPLDYIKNLLIYILNNSIFLKYLIIGIIGFTLQTLLTKLLITFKVFPGIAVAVSSFFAISANFIGNNLWTFSHNKISGASKLLKKFTHFIATSIGAVVIQFIVVSVGVYFWGDNAWFLLMTFAIIFLVIPYNYFIYNRLIWKKTLD